MAKTVSFRADDALHRLLEKFASSQALAVSTAARQLVRMALGQPAKSAALAEAQFAAMAEVRKRLAGK